jgi:hypothetical protein
MLKKWIKIHGPVGAVRGFPPAVTSKIPTAVEHEDITHLVEHLQKFESITLEMQLGGTERCSLEEERAFFDDIINKIENIPPDDKFAGAVLYHLHTDSDIINNPDFESGIIKIQSGREHLLSPQEVDAVKIFKKPAAPRTAPPPTSATYASSIRESVRAEKRLRTELSEYRKTLHVSTTSNICERLNSNAKLVMNYLRKHVDPDTLQLLLPGLIFLCFGTQIVLASFDGDVDLGLALSAALSEASIFSVVFSFLSFSVCVSSS